MPSAALVFAQRWRLARLAHFAVLAWCGIALSGCTGTIEAFRSLRGVNKNDPDPVTAPFTGNMAAAEAAPYPNLASVPPPSPATTAAERQKLTDKLVAERAAAAAQASAGAPATGQPAPTMAANAAPKPSPAATAQPSAGTPATAQPTEAAASGTAPKSPPAAVHLAAAAPGPVAGPTQAPAESNQPLPRDSELQMPQVRSLPEPDVPRPPPAPPHLPPVPAPATGQLPTAALASAAPQTPPPVPELAPIAPPPVPELAKTAPPRVAAITTVAMLDAFDAGQITQVAARYKESLGSQPPRAVRVIAYTAPPAPGTDPLNGYHDALERAQGIAKALAEAGIPEKMIQTEAKPATGPIAAARVEIQFLP